MFLLPNYWALESLPIINNMGAESGSKLSPLWDIQSWARIINITKQTALCQPTTSFQFFSNLGTLVHLDMKINIKHLYFSSFTLSRGIFFTSSSSPAISGSYQWYFFPNVGLWRLNVIMHQWILQLHTSWKKTA